tara:strand:- start:2194 stop:3315 length:1122 start_codon:yes stop_codon:yes gene_type:complete
MRKPRWIIQKNLISENDRNELQEALESLGIAHFETIVTPFSEDLPNFPIDAQHENIYYGSTTFMNNLYKKLRPTGLFYNHKTFSMQNYMDKWGEHMFNFGAEFTTISQFIKNTEDDDKTNVFIRPDGDGKEFDGTVGSARSAKLMLSNILHNDPNVSSSFPIMVGAAYAIKREWRISIVNGEVVSSSQYRNNHTLSKKSDIPSEVKRFAEERAKEYQPHDVFAMDVCEASDDGEVKLYILECGCVNSVGFYHADKEGYVEGVTNYILSKQIPDHTLLINGEAHPWSEEIEVIDDSEFGMNITICYDLSYRKGQVETLHNCTELHHLYDDKKSSWFHQKSSAFESGIFGTGGTKGMNKMKWIVSVPANKKHKNH